MSLKARGLVDYFKNKQALSRRLNALGLNKKIVNTRKRSVSKKELILERIKRAQAAGRQMRKGTITPEELSIRIGAEVKGAKKSQIQKHGIRLLGYKVGTDPIERVAFEERFRRLKRETKLSDRQIRLLLGKERMYGRQLKRSDFQKEHWRTVREGINFAVNLMTQHLPPAERKKIIEQAKKKKLYLLSARDFLTEATSKGVLRELKTTLGEIKNEHLTDTMHTPRYGKISFSQDWLGYIKSDEYYEKKDIYNVVHETMHWLNNKIDIKDVPFGEAAAVAWGMEKGIWKFDKKIGEPTKETFDRVPKEEPDWSYDAGIKIGQWAYTNMEKNWPNYLYLRSVGNSHEHAIRIIGNGKMKEAVEAARQKYLKKKREGKIKI
ncbi:MAG: hypothetical protein NTZ73_04555 [Candidatus Diapherotrites archaeon]|nr:hypothetical protein [Candidatus Diapherotrites archaeon]